jgi:hypothetical protein
MTDLSTRSSKLGDSNQTQGDLHSLIDAVDLKIQKFGTVLETLQNDQV